MTHTLGNFDDIMDVFWEENCLHYTLSTTAAGCCLCTALFHRKSWTQALTSSSVKIEQVLQGQKLWEFG